jgi:hypothetical protein
MLHSEANSCVRRPSVAPRSDTTIRSMSGGSNLSNRNGAVPAVPFLPPPAVPSPMDSVRKALRSGDLDKDTYGRLNCASCEAELSTANDPDEVGSVRECPECGEQWRELN